MELHVGTPFLLYTFGHLTLLLWEIVLMFSTSVVAAIYMPICLVALGGMWDNLRLYDGACLGETGAPSSAIHIAFLFHMVGLPFLLATMGNIIGGVTELTWIPLLGNIAAVTMGVRGLNEFMVTVAGHVSLVKTFKVTRYTLDSQKRVDLLISIALISAAGVLLGLITWIYKSTATVFLLQVLCLIGQAPTPSYPGYGLFVSNFFEVVFLGSLIYAQTLL